MFSICPQLMVKVALEPGSVSILSKPIQTCPKTFSGIIQGSLVRIVIAWTFKTIVTFHKLFIFLSHIRLQEYQTARWYDIPFYYSIYQIGSEPYDSIMNGLLITLPLDTSKIHVTRKLQYLIQQIVYESYATCTHYNNLIIFIQFFQKSTVCDLYKASGHVSLPIHESIYESKIIKVNKIQTLCQNGFERKYDHKCIITSI